MSNYVSAEQTGVVTLQAWVTEEMLQGIFAEAQGNWELFSEDGKSTFDYRFWNEGNYTLRGPDHDAMLERLVSEGYNLTAWREECMYSSENGGVHDSEQLRGTEEQKRELRLQEISQEIAALEVERIELLGGEEAMLEGLELGVRAFQALHSYGLVTIADVRKLGSEEALLRIPNFGRIALHELKDALSQRGQQLF